MADHSFISCLDIIQISGQDNTLFLQGQLTCDLNTLSDDNWTWGAHCDNKGKLLAPFRIFKHQNNYFIMIQTELQDIHLSALKKYAIFNKVSFEIVTHLYSISVEYHQSSEKRLKSTHHDIITLISPFHTLTIKPHSNNQEQANINNNQQFIYHELLQGIPWLQASQSGQFLPQMLNLDKIGAIQYDKGCYIGQEMVARTHFRGVNKRAMAILVGNYQSPIKKDTDKQVMITVNNTQKNAGKIAYYMETIINEQKKRIIAIIMSQEVDDKAQFYCNNEAISLVSIDYEIIT